MNRTGTAHTIVHGYQFRPSKEGSDARRAAGVTATIHDDPGHAGRTTAIHNHRSTSPAGVSSWSERCAADARRIVSMMYVYAGKKRVSSGWTDPDDAPELTADMLGEAEVFKGDQFVRRGPGRSGSIRMCWRGRARADQDGNRGSTLCCARLAMEGATVRGTAGPPWPSRRAMLVSRDDASIDCRSRISLPSGPGTRAFREARAHIHLRPPCEASRWE
jgi:hypothetical protein